MGVLVASPSVPGWALTPSSRRSGPVPAAAAAFRAAGAFALVSVVPIACATDSVVAESNWNSTDSIAATQTDSAVSTDIAVTSAVLAFLLICIGLAVWVWRLHQAKQERVLDEVQEWLYVIGDTQEGPVSTQRMRMLFARGDITETTLVKLVWQSDFAPVKDLWPKPQEAFEAPPNFPPGAAHQDFHRHSCWAQPKDGMMPKHQWFYMSPDGNVHGPFETGKMRHWFAENFFTLETPVRVGPDQMGQYGTIAEHFPHCLQNADQAAQKIFLIDPLIPAKCRGKGWKAAHKHIGVPRKMDGATNFPTEETAAEKSTAASTVSASAASLCDPPASPSGSGGDLEHGGSPRNRDGATNLPTEEKAAEKSTAASTVSASATSPCDSPASPSGSGGDLEQGGSPRNMDGATNLPTEEKATEKSTAASTVAASAASLGDLPASPSGSRGIPKNMDGAKPKKKKKKITGDKAWRADAA